MNVSYGYDSGANGKGHRTSMTDGSGSTSWTYDTRGRMVSESKIINGGGTFTSSWTYNSADQQTSMTYPVDGEVVNYTYNSRMLLDSVIGTSTYVSSTTYDAAGQMDVRSFGNNTQTNYDYYPWNTQGGRLQYLKSDTTGNPTSLQNFTYSYDTVGNISSIVDSLAGPQTQSFTYDSLDRLTSGAATGGTNGLYSEAYTYNATTGNLAAKDPTASAPPPPNPGTTGLVSWWNMNETGGTRGDQHSTNHLSDNNTVTSTGGKQGNAAYFTAANSEFLSIPSNATLSMGSGVQMTACAWVKLNSKTGLQNFLSKRGAAGYEYFLRYDGGSDRFVFLASSDGSGSSLVTASADAFGSPAVGTWYFVCGGYDGNNLWVSVNAGTRNTVSFPSGIYGGTNTFYVGSSYNSNYLDGALDEVLLYKRTLSTSEVGWLYNSGAGRTYSELTPLSGNTLNYGYSDSAHAHAVTHLNAVQKYWYDANGNQTTRIVNGQTFNLTYDAENRLAAVSGAATASFTYDGDGRQVISVSAGNTIYYANDFYQKTGTGIVTKYYFAGTQRVAVRVSGTLYYLMADHLGSSSLGLDASGSKFSEVRYKPWGETRYSSGTIPTNYKYTGQREEPSIGLYFYNARWYGPCIMQFNQPDTIIPELYNPQSLNRYSYANNNPIRYTDPTGHRIVEGCSELAGGCNITQRVIDEDKRKENKFRQKTEYGQCWNGDVKHCSKLDDAIVHYIKPLENFDFGDGTIQMGFGINGFAFGNGLRGDIGVAMDFKGNLALVKTGGWGGYTGKGGGVGGYLTVTNAPSVNYLKGPNVEIGGQVGEGETVGAEIVLFQGAGRDRYKGISISDKAHFEETWSLPGEVHTTITGSSLMWQINIPHAIFDVFHP